jgi:hypothetical protein
MYDILRTVGDFFSSPAAPAAAVAAHGAVAPAQAAPSSGGLAPEVARPALSSAIDGILDSLYATQGWDRDAMAARAEKREGKRDAKLGAGEMIGDEWFKPGDADAALFDPTRSLGELGTKEERLAALAKLAQNDPNDPNAEFECGPTSLIAAAIYSQGAGGMESLMKAMEGAGPDKARAKEFAALRARLAKGGELNVGDMQMMKGELYETLKSLEPDGQDFGKGVFGPTMQDFIRDNPGVAQMFEGGDLQLNLTDTDGNATLNHYTLGINDPDGWMVRDGASNKVFDPYARRGGQLVTAPDQVLDYDNAWHEKIYGGK